MMRQLVKSASLSLLRSAGVFALAARSRKRSSRLVILCYHGLSLSDEHLWAGSLYMQPELFRHRLKSLRDLKANVLPLGEALVRLQAGTLPPLAVAITFDDGFYDTLKHAAPLLREFSMPATLYLTTHYCRYRMPIFNLLMSYLLWKCGQPSFDWPEAGIFTLPIQTPEQRAQVVRRLMQWCDAQDLNTPAKDQLGRRIAQHLGFDYTDLLSSRLFQIVTEEEARQLPAFGFDLQLHTHRHRTPRNRDLFIREIEDNRRRIQEISSDANPVHFCYPSGDYSLQFLPWLREWGVLSATTCQPGMAHPGSEPLLLPRYLDGEQVSQLEFESWICGLR